MKTNSQSPKSSDDTRLRAVDRVAAVLDALTHAEGPRSLTEVAAAANLSVPTVFRFLRALQRHGLVMANADRSGYTLGFRVLELANALQRNLDVVALARPYLIRLRNTVNETAGLVVRQGDQFVPVACIEAAQQVRRVVSVGESVPLYADSTGRVFLAELSREDLEAYMRRTRMEPFSPATKTDPAALRQAVERVRKDGHAVSINERGAGGAGVAAPVRSHDRRLVAAVTIAAPASRFSRELRQACIEAVVEAANDISAALGYAATPAKPRTSIC